jgi:hypothetical protein
MGIASKKRNYNKQDVAMLPKRIGICISLRFDFVFLMSAFLPTQVKKQSRVS